jgi:catechol 2,3-dioxygenase-like lactoylglutathione lyase family enzyme
MITAITALSGFSVDNIKEAKKFYVDTLQLKLTDESMGLQLELPGGGTHLIYEKEDHVPAEYTVLNFVVESIDEAVDHLAGHHGITFEIYDNLAAPQDEKGILRGKAANEGPDIAWFKDPAGNVLSVIES